MNNHMAEPEMLIMKVECSFEGCGNRMEIYEVKGADYYIFAIGPEEDLSLRGRIRMAWRYILHGEKALDYRRQIWIRGKTVEQMLENLAKIYAEISAGS